MNGNIARSSNQYIPSLKYSRRDFYRQLCRHYKKAICAFLLVASAAALFTFLSPSVYQSQSLLYVRLGRENVRLDPTTTFGQTSVMAIPDSRENEINSLVEILKSRALAEKVVDSLGAEYILGADEFANAGMAASGEEPVGLQKKLREFLVQMRLSEPSSLREQALGKLKKNFSAQAFNKSDLLSLSYRAKSPELAQSVVSKFTDLYLDEHAGLNRARNAHQFLKQQTERLRVELTQSEEQLKELKRDRELASPDSQRELLVARLGRLEDELLTTETLAIATKSEVEALTQKLLSISATQIAVTEGLSNPAADGMRQLLYSLQLQEKELAGKYTNDHPELKSIREQIVESQAILSQEKDARSTVTEGPNRAFEELDLARLRQEAVLTSTLAKAQALRDQVDTAKKQLDSQIESELLIATLLRDVQLQDASYRKYVENLEQADIDHALEAERISNINVVQPATYVEGAVGPNVLLNLVAGLIGGVIAAIGTAVLCDVLDHSLKTPEEIEEKLKLPMLVAIPHLNRRQLVLRGRN